MSEASCKEIEVQVVTLAHFEGLSLPEYVTEGSAGFDLCAAIYDDKVLLPGDIALIPTGLKMALPPAFELQIRPRSGLAVKYGITVVNSPGTIDSDYRGEIKIGLINLGKKPFVISRGMRIAQGVLNRVFKLSWQKVKILPESERGSGGFGHSGIT